MKIRKIFAGMAASAIAITAFAASASAFNAGIAFQTNTTWNYRNGFSSYDEDPATAAFPNKVVGVQGGAYGNDASIDCTDVAIDHDGTYTITMPVNGVIDANIQTYDDGTQRSGDALKWSMAKNYEMENDAVIDGTVTDYFNFILITTDIECEVDEDDDGNAFAVVDGKEIHCKDVTLSYGSNSYHLDEAVQKSDEDYVTFEVANHYNKEGQEFAESLAMPSDGDTMQITFTIEGYADAPADDNNNDKPADDANKPADDTNKPADDANKPADDTNKPADDANTPADNNNNNNNTNNNNNNANNNNNVTTSTTTTTSTASDDNTQSGAAAGIALAGIAVAGAAIVVAKRK